MNLLLDTHIWVWSVATPERLTRKVRTTLESSRTETWLSPISVWELSLLVSRGRLRLARSVDRWTAEASAALRDAPLTREVAIESGRLPSSLVDPADRFIAATSRVYGLKLVTADERLIGVPDLDVLENR